MATTDEGLTELRYHRSVEREGHDSLSEIARYISPQSCVLDIGSSSGALGRFLSEQKSCVVDGVERSHEAAQVSRSWYRRVLEIDLETADLRELLARNGYDIIVCADVLEHLREPEITLSQLRHLLKPEGRLLVSIPNLGYVGVVLSLLNGKFHYTETGLLDRSHLRFFTRTSLLEMLQRLGFAVKNLSRIRMELQQTEFRDYQLDTLPPSLRRALLTDPDALTYQFIVEAGTGPADGKQLSIEPVSAPDFHAQLYWRTESEDFSEGRSAIAVGRLGDERQKLAFNLPALESRISKLRLDLLDRPGFIRLYSLRLMDSNATTVWTWEGEMEKLAPLQMRQLVAINGFLGDCLLSVGDDPSIELPLSSRELVKLQDGGTLVVEMSWPISSDFLVARQQLETQRATLARETEVLRDQVSRSESQHQRQLAESLRLLEQLGDSIKQFRIAHDRDTDELRQRTTSIEGELQADKLLQVKQAEEDRKVVREDHKALFEQLASIQALQTSFRKPSRGSRTRFKETTYRALRERHFAPVPTGQVRVASGGELHWESTGSNPSFELLPDDGSYPQGWVEVEVGLHGLAGQTFTPCIHVNHGDGYAVASRVTLPDPVGGTIRALVRLPKPVHALRFVPMQQPGRLSIDRVRIRQVGSLEALVRLGLPYAKPLIRHPARLPETAKNLYSVWRSEGLLGIKRRLAHEVATPPPPSPEYRDWIQRYDTLTDSDRLAIRHRVAELQKQPTFSVLLPLRDCDEECLREAIASVQAQLYSRWQLCILGDLSSKIHLGAMVQTFCDDDNRIQCSFNNANAQLGHALNSGGELAQGDFVLVLHERDRLRDHSLYMLAEEVNSFPAASLIYTDEDKIDERGERQAPHFKSDWNSDLFLSYNYLSHLTAVRRSQIQRVGGFRTDFPGNEEYDLLLRCTDASADADIRHIPHILYHARDSQHAAQPEEPAAPIVDVLKSYLQKRSTDLDVRPGLLPESAHICYPISAPPPLVSILIPTRDGFSLLRRCIESIRLHTDYVHFEIIIVNNQSTETQLLEYLTLLQKSGHARALTFDQPFNFSAINNLAAHEARGEVLAFLNNDLEVISPGWLSEMVGLALRQDVGAVGALLRYPDDRIQHAGIVLGMHGLAAHLYRGMPAADAGYHGRARLTQRLSAVTGACLVLRRDVFEQIQGFDETLPMAFNDVDLCLRLQQRGYHNIFTPFAQLYHHESATRGPDDSAEKQARLRKDIEIMVTRWGEAVREDPFFNANLSLANVYPSLAFPPRAQWPWHPSFGDK